MALSKIATTDAENATHLLDTQSTYDHPTENSSIWPIKTDSDLILQLDDHHGTKLRTPSMRRPFTNRRNVTATPSQEFTPLLKSITKRNTFRAARVISASHTPAFLRAGYEGKESPALQAPESSAIYEDETRSSINAQHEPVPKVSIESSSAQSTPLAVLPKRNVEGVVNDQGTMMPLREQENMIDKFEKENFGLKLKIHYLEDLLKNAGPELNQVALKENTTLRVDKVSMQKELVRSKKLLIQAECDLDSCREKLQDARETASRRNADISLQIELENLRQNIRNKDEQISDLNRRLAEGERRNGQVVNLEGRVEDLEADLREREREMDDKDEELEEKANLAADKVAQLQEDLEDANDRVEELVALQEVVRNLQEDLEHANTRATEAEARLQEAQQLRRRTTDDLDELRDEMHDKSFSTKGLSRQLEEKVSDLENELADCRKNYAVVEDQLQEKIQETDHLQQDLERTKTKAAVQEQELKSDLELLRRQHSSATCSLKSSTEGTGIFADDLRRESEEKEMLQTRHDALTIESQTLQQELAKAEAQISKLKQNIEEEQRHSFENETILRREAKEQIDCSTKELDSVQQKLEHEKCRIAAKEQEWHSQRREIQLQKERAEQRAHCLQNNIDSLQGVEGTTSAREVKIQETLESETRRHHSEEAVLQQHLKDIEIDMEYQKRSLEDRHSDILKLKEELRMSRRDQDAAETKIQSLEDEIYVLQTNLDKEVGKAQGRLAEAREEAEHLRNQVELFQRGKEADCERTGQSALGVYGLESHLKPAASDEEAFQDSLSEPQVKLYPQQATAVLAEPEELQERREDVERRLASFRPNEQPQEAGHLAIQKTVSRLRTRIQDLKQELRIARLAHSDERIVVEERKDLHEMLKDAKLEAENLQVQIADRDVHIETVSDREKALLEQIQRIRDDRSLQRAKATALAIELDSLQLRYEQKLDEMKQQQQMWDEGRRAMASRAGFASASVAELHWEHTTELKTIEKQLREKERRHAGELRGLAKQIQWLRAKCRREEGFRASLAFEKKFLLLKIEMFEACNTVDLHMLEEMGVTPDRKIREKRPSLKAVGLMIVAGVRLERLRNEWSAQRKLQANLTKKAAQVKRSSRKSSG